MKNKSLAIFGMTSALLATSLVCSSHTMQVDAFDVTKQGNTQAQLYRYLQETRAAANAQGQDYIKQKSELVSKNNLSVDSADAATKAYIENCIRIAHEHEEKNSSSAREKLLDNLNSEDKEDGVKFASPEVQAEQQQQITDAVKALTKTLNKTSKYIKNTASSKSESSSTNDAQTFSSDQTTEDQFNALKDSDGEKQISLSEVALCEATSYNVSDGTGKCNSAVRTHMAYTKVTSRSSAQYALLNSEDAYTDKKTGLRMYQGRYCIAVGSGYTQKIGSKIDLVMEDGSIIQCVLGDCKADKDTDAETHTYCKWDGSVAEFIIDNEYFNTNTTHNPVNTALNQFGKIKKVVVIG